MRPIIGVGGENIVHPTLGLLFTAGRSKGVREITEADEGDYSHHRSSQPRLTRPVKHYPLGISINIRKLIHAKQHVAQIGGRNHGQLRSSTICGKSACVVLYSGSSAVTPLTSSSCTNATNSAS